MKEVRASDESGLGGWMAMVVVFLMGVGVVAVYSAGANVSHSFELHRIYEFPGIRQILFFPLAVGLLYLVSVIDYHRLGFARGFLTSLTPYLFVFSVGLLIVVLTPQFGAEINQARRWLRIPVGPVTISFQPSELAKWTTIFLVAAACARFGADVRRYWLRFLPLCGVIAVVVGLVILEDFGTAAFIALIAFLVLIFAGVRWWHVATLVPPAAATFTAALLASPHRITRLAAFVYPDRWGSSAAYQAQQSLIAMGSGGPWGKGLGLGICKYGHLPEDTTDFVFAIIGEELGLVGTLGVIGLFVVFVCLGMLVVLRAPDRFGRLLAGGIVLAIGLQAAINIGVVTVVLPTKGIPLPFISGGGTSLLLSAAAVGVLVNVAKHCPAKQAKSAT